MKNVTAAEAYALQQKGHTYVDIRSSAEFDSGHPAGALNVPLIEQDAESGQMLPNPDFVRVMQANFAPDAKLLIGCQSGGRSARAAQILDDVRVHRRLERDGRVRRRPRHDERPDRRSGLGRIGPAGRDGYAARPRLSGPRRKSRRARSDRERVSRLGAAPRFHRHQSNRPAIRVGVSTGSTSNRVTTGRGRALSSWSRETTVGERSILRRRRRRATTSGTATFCGFRARSMTPHAGEQRRHRPNLPRAVGQRRPIAARRSSCCRSGIPTPRATSGLCQVLARFGVTALRLSLPYHDQRRPAELERAEYIVSSNVGRTLHANRQAVLDAKRAIDWLASQGYDRIGVLGTSLGSCLSMLTMAHDPRVRAGAFNHISPYFADVVWRGLSTRHVRDRPRRPSHARRAARILDAHQPVAVHRTHSRPADPARVRALRPDVSG